MFRVKERAGKLLSVEVVGEDGAPFGTGDSELSLRSSFTLNPEEVGPSLMVKEGSNMGHDIRDRLKKQARKLAKKERGSKKKGVQWPAAEELEGEYSSSESSSSSSSRGRSSSNCSSSPDDDSEVSSSEEEEEKEDEDEETGLSSEDDECRSTSSEGESGSKRKRAKKTASSSQRTTSSANTSLLKAVVEKLL